MNKIKLFQGDCLELLRTIEDKSINLVLTDPPYNIAKAKWDKWKTQEEYVEWCGKWFLECQRVLKDNGSLYFFHNDMVQIAQLMEWIRKNTGFVFNSFIIWDKGNFRAQSWKNPSEKSKLRSWFNTCEYCLYYTFESDYFYRCIEPSQTYFKELIYENGGSVSKFNDFYCKYSGKTGVFRGHFFGKSQPSFFTEEQYNALVEYIKELNPNSEIREYEELRKEYEELRKEYEELRYTHNLDQNHNNIWTSTEKRNSGKLHPTQKPTDILERIIKTSSNTNDTVLDCFMGSGSTGVAAVNLNRDFIGIEKDEGYFKIAKDRIEKAQQDKV